MEIGAKTPDPEFDNKARSSTDLERQKNDKKRPENEISWLASVDSSHSRGHSLKY